MPDLGSGDDEDDVWPVEPSEAAADVLADPALPVEMSSTIEALTVAIAQDPWLADSREVEPGSMWRTLPIPRGGQGPGVVVKCPVDGDLVVRSGRC